MRDNAVSITKAVGIILMVLAHATDGHITNRPIGMFHMPLFFIMSGYCFNDKCLSDTWLYIKKKLKGIWLPFVKWNILFLLLHNVFWHFNILNAEYGHLGVGFNEFSLTELLTRIVCVVFTFSREDDLLGGFWFLRTLFWSSILYFMIRKCQKYSKLAMGGVILLLLIFSILNHEIPVFGIGAKELWGCIFIHIGHQLRLYYSKYQAYLNTSWYNLGAVVLLAIGCCYWPTSILGHKPACLFPYTISALTTTILVFNLSRRLTASTLEGAKKCLTYIGDHTLQILTWHFLSFKIISYVIIKTYNLQIERLSEYPTIIEYSLQGWWIPYLIIGIATPLLLDRFILSKINLLDRIIKIKT